MSNVFRTSICNAIADGLKINLTKPNTVTKLNASLEIKQKNGNPEIHLSLQDLNRIIEQTQCDITALPKLLSSVNHIETTLEKSLTKNQQKLIFHLNKNEFIAKTLNEGVPSVKTDSPENVVLDFSSPNIAKPFHVGHLRSTIIGNFISNLLKSVGHRVTRINYLGDWGTQFGLLKVGKDIVGLSDKSIQTEPIKNLYQAYVHANTLAANDSKITEKAREIFRRLENGDTEDMTQWNLYRKYTVDELSRVYQRLGVEFDEYCWESEYRMSNIEKCLKELHKCGLMSVESDGKQVAKLTFDDKENIIPIIKSDGTGLYITRDIAALMDRAKKYNFNRMLYIVENGQNHHFRSLIEIGKKLKIAGIDGVEHIKFGRIHGMSTRRGQVVFLSDILDEAQDIMRQKQIESPTTKIDLSDNQSYTENILGVSAVIVNDLKQKRTRDYNFDWNKVLQTNGDTGVKLQYTHCRLCSLAEVANVEIADECNPELLQEDLAIALIIEIAKYPEIMYKCVQSLESCILVNYLFSLSNTTSRALKVLKVKNCSNLEISRQRMLLFMTAKSVLSKGMQILGLKPLQKM